MNFISEQCQIFKIRSCIHYNIFLKKILSVNLCILNIYISYKIHKRYHCKYTFQIHRQRNEQLSIDGCSAQRFQLCPVLPSSGRISSVGSIGRRCRRRLFRQLYTIVDRRGVNGRFSGRRAARFAAVPMDGVNRW